MEQDLRDDVLRYVRQAWVDFGYITWRDADGYPLISVGRLAIALGYASQEDVQEAVDQLVRENILRYNDDVENGRFLRPRIDEN